MSTFDRRFVSFRFLSFRFASLRFVDVDVHVGDPVMIKYIKEFISVLNGNANLVKLDRLVKISL